MNRQIQLSALTNAALSLHKIPPIPRWIKARYRATNLQDAISEYEVFVNLVCVIFNKPFKRETRNLQWMIFVSKCIEYDLIDCIKAFNPSRMVELCYGITDTEDSREVHLSILNVIAKSGSGNCVQYFFKLFKKLKLDDLRELLENYITLNGTQVSQDN